MKNDNFFLLLLTSLYISSGSIFLKRDGAEEAYRAHNPGVGGSKPSLATLFFIFKFLSFSVLFFLILLLCFVF
jgi:hypothetical protein